VQRAAFQKDGCPDKGGADIAPATAIIPVIPSICLRFMAFLLFGQLPSHKLVEGMKAG